MKERAEVFLAPSLVMAGVSFSTSGVVSTTSPASDIVKRLESYSTDKSDDGYPFRLGGVSRTGSEEQNPLTTSGRSSRWPSVNMRGFTAAIPMRYPKSESFVMTDPTQLPDRMIGIHPSA